MSEERTRLSRWSERKAAARRGEVLPEPADEAHAAQGAALDPDLHEPNEVAGTAGAPDDDMPVLPPIGELTAESDYTVFLHAKVPETLRRAALRKLWRSDPVLANLDGLNDYDEDYNVVDTLITSAQTAYRAGSGYVDEIEDKLDKVEKVLGEDAGDDSKKLSETGDVADAGATTPDDGSVNQEVRER